MGLRAFNHSKEWGNLQKKHNYSQKIRKYYDPLCIKSNYMVYGIG